MTGKDIIEKLAEHHDAQIEVTDRDGMSSFCGWSFGWRPYCCEDEYFGLDGYFEEHGIVLGEEMVDEIGVYRLPIQAGDFDLTTSEGLEALLSDSDDELVECYKINEDGKEVPYVFGEHRRLKRLYKAAVMRTH